MSMKHGFLLFVLLLSALRVRAQDTIPLSEVEVSDTQLKRFSETRLTISLDDSILRKNDASLTSLLNFNSTVYFKENGLGMVSSPSFRGTTASQTAVLWNGININSQLNGQTDFNTVNPRTFDEIDVQSGGGSVLYGSGAMGGSIHLNNRIRFGNGFKNTLFGRYGSFNTQDYSYKSAYSSQKLSLNLAISAAKSDNDYDYVDSNLKNINGEYKNATYTFNGGYKLNEKNLLKLYTYFYEGYRHLSLIVPSETKTKYVDYTTRNLIEWDGFYGRFISKLKLAYITERYKYYQNIENDSYTEGKTHSAIGKYDLAYQVSDHILLNGVADVTITNGEGSSIPENSRTITAFNLMWKHKLSANFLYEVTGRKEFTNNYESPFLYSLGTNYRFNSYYSVQVNGSRNFRIPTYNDLYWAGSGNPDLKPETSYQAELGNRVTLTNASLLVTGFYNNIEDMIVWVPASGNWVPMNVRHVETYGAEALVQAQRAFNNHTIKINLSYSYTVSKDTNTGYQLIYVPYHKGVAMLQYNYKAWQVYYQSIYVGEVFTQTDNNSLYNLDAYTVSNIGAEYQLPGRNNIVIGGQVKNVFNKNYRSVANRFMPGINYNFYLNFNF